MGTRSRLVIRRTRSGKKPMYLWMKWDGYFEGVGAWLCAELKKLLETYTIPDIWRMIDALDLEDEEDGQYFDTKDLIPFLEGKTKYKNDPCDDIEYEYILDADLGMFIGKHYEEQYILHFDQLREGKNFDIFHDAEASEETEDKIDQLIHLVRSLNEEEKREVLETIKHMLSK